MKTTLPNCGPTALSFVTGEPINDLMESFRNHFGFTSKWKGRSCWSQLLSWLDLKNKKYKRVPVGGSLKTWVNNNTAPNGVYMVRVGNHFLTVKNQLLYDQNEEGKSSDDFWAKKRRVTHAVEIGKSEVKRTTRKAPAKYCIDNDPAFLALWD